MIFGKGERRRTRRTSNENLTKSAKIATFWQGSFYSCLACLARIKFRPKNAILSFYLFNRIACRSHGVFNLFVGPFGFAESRALFL